MNRLDYTEEFMTGLQRGLQYWLDAWQQPAAGSALPPEHGHEQRLLHWAAFTRAFLPLAVDLALAMHPTMLYTGQWIEWKTCLGSIAAASADRVDADRQFHLLHYLADVCFRRGDLNEAIAWAEQVIFLARAAQEQAQAAIAVNLLAEIYLAAEDYRLAQDYAQQGLALINAASSKHRQADAYINAARACLGAAVTAAGGLEAVEQQPLTAEHTRTVEEWLQQALALALAADNATYQAKAHLFLHHTLAVRGAWAQALGHAQTALSLVESYGDDAGRSVVLQAVGRSLAGLSRRAEAIEALQSAMRIHEHHGNRLAQQNTQRRLEKLLQVN